MATVTLTPSNYYQGVNGIITAINPSRKYVQVDSTGATNYYVYAEFNIPSNIKHVLVTDNQIKVTGCVARFRYTCRQAYYSGNISVGDRLTNSGKIISKNSWSSLGDEYERVSSISGLSSTKFYVILGATYVEIDDRNYFENCTLTLTYSTTTSKPTITMSPTSGWIDRTKPFDFRVSLGGVSDMLMQYKAISSELFYRSTGAYTSLPYDDAYNVSVPANTFSTGGTYEIYTTTTLDDNSTLSTDIGTFSTVDGTAVVTPISPSNEITRGSATFTWSYFNERGTQQYAYELSYRVNGGTWVYPTGKVVSSDQTVTLAIESAGTVEWSVRAYNQDDVAGEWSSYLSFINYVPPSPPTIVSVTHTGRPVISWAAADQIAYEVKVEGESDNTVYTSGQIYSGNQSHKVEEYLPEGSYTFYVRIVSVLGLASDWATTNYTQSFDLSAPVFTLTDVPDGVQIAVEASAQFTKYYILRNGELIGSTTGTFTDQFSAGEVVYTVIGVTANDESAFATQTINHRVLTTTLKMEDGTVINASRRWNQRISPTKSVEPEFGLFSYIGASRPEIITSKMRNVRYGFGFHDVNRIAETLIGQPLFYSDIFGNADWVQITAISRTDVWYGNETTLELTVVLHDEDIDYDA